MNETIEIIREARKAGMQTALVLFGCLVIVSALFGFYIYKSFNEVPSGHIEAAMDNQTGNNTISQEIR